MTETLPRPTVANPAEARHSGAALGIILCVLAVSIFGFQDALTKLIGTAVPVAQFVMIRQWAFATFIVLYAASQHQLVSAARSAVPGLQIGRALLLLGDIAFFVLALRFLGLADVHAIFATSPLLVTLLSAYLLGEKVGWRRRLAVTIGFIGALLIIGPSFALNSSGVIFALGATLCWTFYSIGTRLVSRRDSFLTSTLYTGVASAAIATPFGLASWQNLDGGTALIVASISLTSIAGHMLFIKALQHAQAIVLQPFTYLLLVWASFYGFVLFDTVPSPLTIAGAFIVVASGLYVAWREWVLKAGPPDQSIV